jgi:protein-S-isoprenylcysteine O-methyltransferase Ste14
MPSSSDNAGVIARPPLIYLSALLIALVCQALWPLPILESRAGLWPGVAAVALGVGNAIWGRRTMQAAGTNINPSLPATAVVTSGPFQYSRNPLYVSLTLMYLGLTAAFNTWWGVVLLVPVLVVMHVGVVLREERYLEQKFGESYRQYRSNVRRYF